MTSEEKKALVRDLLHAMDIDQAREHPGLVETIPTLQMLSAAFSDTEIEIPLQICEGDWIATRAVFHQTHSGPFMGQPPTNRRVKNEVLFFHRVVDGVIVQQHSQADSVGVMSQLGVLPTDATSD